MKYLKTPLRYPGGKSRVCDMLVNRFSSDVSEFREPFLGGGSVALHFTQRDPEIPVWVNDKYTHLYNFWDTLQRDGDELSDILVGIKQDNSTPEKAKELFIRSKEEISTADPYRQAILFWILNKCSYSGLTENSSFSPQASIQNFTLRGARKLKAISEIIQHRHITNLDYTEVMYETGENVFIFLDPPYKIKDFLYGSNAEMHKGFNHQDFVEACKLCPHPWLVTYNVDADLKEAYAEFYQEEFRITYGMKHRADNKFKSELLVANYDMNPKSPLETLFV